MLPMVSNDFGKAFVREVISLVVPLLGSGIIVLCMALSGVLGGFVVWS